MPRENLDQKQEKYPLDLFLCLDCGHLQLLDVVNPSILFENYVYVSGTSPVFVDHFRQYAKFILEGFNPAPSSLVIDIGSNDGTLLRFFKDAGMRILGIDPAKDIAHKATEEGLETMTAFFSSDLADAIKKKHGTAAVITANNVFAHADDLADIVRGIRNLLAPDGIFAFEVSYLVDVYQNTLFDTIYHEHLAYHSVKPLRGFFAKHAMEMIGAYRVSSHGGSLRGIAQLAGGPRKADPSVAAQVALEDDLGLSVAETFQHFAANINKTKRKLGELLKNIRSAGKKIAGFGAPAKATTLMHHFELGADILDFIVDDNPIKQGLYTPGHHIPVLPSSAIYERKPDYLLVLAWNFAKSILGKHKAYTDAGGHFIIPLPTVEII